MTLRIVTDEGPPPAGPAPLLVSYLEAARLLGGVSTRHVERLVAAKKLKAVGQSRARRIVYRSILSYIEREGDDG